VREHASPAADLIAGPDLAAEMDTENPKIILT
jgi:hypothetical protein